MRVLIIEDERELARHVVGALTRHGHFATAQHDGAAGLEAALVDPPDLIILDLEELIARIEALGRRGGTPTVSDLLKVADL